VISSASAQSTTPVDSIFASGVVSKDDDVFAKQYRLLRSRFSVSGLDPSGHLPIIGENIFHGAPSRALPAASLPLPPDYLLGPGDVLGIYLLGKSQQEMQITVAADGKIYLPSAGVVEVSGRTLDQARTVINDVLAKVFGGYDLQIVLISPKIVSIDVAGEVRRPGRYALSALNSVLDALSSAGGISPLGSLRQVRLVRIGAPPQAIDLYRFILQQASHDDVFLQSGDRIFVPPAQSWAALTGEVMRPGIYELGLQPATIEEAVTLAGGIAPLADLHHVELSRLDSAGLRASQIIDLSRVGKLPLRHGDRVRVYSKLQDARPGAVSIFGEVREPGTFPFERGLRVNDLIQKAGGLTRFAHLAEAEIARVDPGRPPKIIKFPLEKLANGDTLANPAVHEDDQIFIRHIPDWNLGPLVEIRGEVQFPGKYPIARDRTTLEEIIALAGGFTPRALLREARLLRPAIHSQVMQSAVTGDSMPPERLTKAEYDDFVMRRDLANLNQVSVNFHKLFAAGDRTFDVILQPNDVIHVPRIDSLIYVSGRVGLPGGVPFVSGKGAGYYILKAGGVTHDAVRGKAKVIRASGEVVDDDDASKLEPGDAIWVPRKGDRSRWDTFRDIITVLAQLATIYVVIDRATQ
jgi:protein involved in polysaccharide export with SLBB domain